MAATLVPIGCRAKWGSGSMIAKLLIIGLLFGSFITTEIMPAQAITAEEMLDDPVLESRARELSKGLRCLVCQNQSIDDSDADLARDLRLEVRAQLLTGASDAAVIENLRSKYGDYLLLNPPISPGTYILWIAPFAIILLGAGLIYSIRRTAPSNAPAPVTKTPSGTTEVSPARASIGTKLTFASLVLAASLGLYLMLGRADLGDQPLAKRQAEIAAAKQAEQIQSDNVNSALAIARQTVIDQPERLVNWLQLALAAAEAGDSQTEIGALRQALKITNGDNAVKSMLAEALSRAADGQITIPARALIKEVLSDDATEPRALYLDGLAAYQDEDYSRAIAVWQHLQAISAPDAPWVLLLDENIADAANAGGLPIPEPKEIAADLPTSNLAASDVEAASGMSAEERNAMINSMVSGLAERLADEPDDIDGWQRLARAYEVLGREGDAVAALIGAANAAPQDPDQQLAALEKMISSGQENAFGDAARQMIKRIENRAPNRLELFYLRGHFAKLAGNKALAEAEWQALIDQLPTGSPFTAQLLEAIAAL